MMINNCLRWLTATNIFLQHHNDYIDRSEFFLVQKSKKKRIPIVLNNKKKYKIRYYNNNRE